MIIARSRMVLPFVVSAFWCGSRPSENFVTWSPRIIFSIYLLKRSIRNNQLLAPGILPTTQAYEV